MCKEQGEKLGSRPTLPLTISDFPLLESESESRVQLFVTPWTIQLMEFSRPEYWSGSPFPSPGDLPNPGIEPRSPTLQADSLPAEPQGISSPGNEQRYLIFLRAGARLQDILS